MTAKNEDRLTPSLSIPADCLDDVIDALARSPELLDLVIRFRGWVLQCVCEKNLVARAQARTAELAIDLQMEQAPGTQTNAPLGRMDLILIIPYCFNEDPSLKAACLLYAAQLLFVDYKLEADLMVNTRKRITELEHRLGAANITSLF